MTKNILAIIMAVASLAIVSCANDDGPQCVEMYYHLAPDGSIICTRWL